MRPYGLQFMNKSQLIDALAARIGDRRTAASAVDGLLSTIVETVKSGESVSLTGFGVFESRPRAARVGRNPRTGETVAVPAATVPAFRPGTGFRSAVGGVATAPAPRTAPKRSRAAAAAVEAPAKSAAATKAPTTTKSSAKSGAAKSQTTAAKATKATKTEDKTAGDKKADDKKAKGKSKKAAKK
jgi:DNA-binding protein HU-beta